MIAAALGADEFAFGSAALVAAGCVMARQCHLNTCPVGIATQREELRRKFRGTPEDAIRFFGAIAEETREILASLGHRSLEDIVGDTSILEARTLSRRDSRRTRLGGRALAVACFRRVRPQSGRQRFETNHPCPPDLMMLCWRVCGRATATSFH